MQGSKDTLLFDMCGGINLEQLDKAAQTLREGGLVAFPTETVYGLGANALDDEAVLGIFQAKGRPQDNPLIVHIAEVEQLSSIVEVIPPSAEVLMQRFWPGPLSLIFKKSEQIPLRTSGGLDTVAVRMPDHAVALALLSHAKVPVAAPSANISGRPSPTTASHVLADLAGKIDCIIDGGATGIGVESTVLDLTSTPPMVLRPGGITLEELRGILGRVEMDPSLIKQDGSVRVARAPGMKYRHYAPKANVYLVLHRYAVEQRVSSLANRLVEEGKRVAIMAPAESIAAYTNGRIHLEVMGQAEKPATVAANLYSLLRKMDSCGIDDIVVQGIEEKGLGFAVMNRLRKAAGGKVL